MGRGWTRINAERCFFGRGCTRMNADGYFIQTRMNTDERGGMFYRDVDLRGITRRHV